MDDYFSRSELLLGEGSINTLSNKKVIVFGIGGVGGYVCEALARTSVKTFTLVDADTVSTTNINRQIIATSKTVGRLKVDVMKERILDINPSAVVNTKPIFYLPNQHDGIDLSDYDYVIDCIDTVTAKLDIICEAKEKGIRVISSMGAGNKLDPSKFEVADIYNTSVCPLAKVMRLECRKRGIQSLKVVYSKEPSLPITIEDENGKKRAPGSVSFVPSVCGLMIAGEVIKDLLRAN